VLGAGAAGVTDGVVGELPVSADDLQQPLLRW
jgi:hypothetical protein